MEQKKATLKQCKGWGAEIKQRKQEQGKDIYSHDTSTTRKTTNNLEKLSNTVGKFPTRIQYISIREGG